jgi:hypothetical protein
MVSLPPAEDVVASVPADVEHAAVAVSAATIAAPRVTRAVLLVA